MNVNINRLLLFLLGCCLAFHLKAQDVADQNISYSYPDIPLLEIITQNAEEPTATPITAPEGLMGVSITDNVYVPGNMKLWVDHQVVYESGDFDSDTYGMKIKIRGNSSAFYGVQCPYKIKLGVKFDLFMSDDAKLANKEWALVAVSIWNSEIPQHTSDFLPLLGAAVSRALGTEWTPRYQFVNVVMNGTYRGCYLLAETIGRSDGRVKTKKTGFVIENDAYWWKPGEDYFQTERLPNSIGYTFKYPNDEAITDSVKTLYTDYMNEVESWIYNNAAEADHCIDYTSFARWLLVHDILGTYDAGGSNMFLYKEDMDLDDPFSSLLKMGPTWDYDSSFMVGEMEYAEIHRVKFFYYHKLFQKPAFVAEYIRQWDNVKDDVYSKVAEDLQQLLQNQGTAIAQSLTASHAHYKQRNVLLETQCAELLKLLSKRLKNLDNLIHVTIGTHAATAEPAAPSACYDLSGRRVALPASGSLYIQGNRVVMHR